MVLGGGLVADLGGGLVVSLGGRLVEDIGGGLVADFRGGLVADLGGGLVADLGGGLVVLGGRLEMGAALVLRFPTRSSGLTWLTVLVSKPEVSSAWHTTVQQKEKGKY